MENQQSTSDKKVLWRQYKTFKNELPKLLPIIYLCMIGIGMIFNYYKYNNFGVNIFQFASVFDFLISPFEDYIIILFTLLSFTFCSLLYLLDSYMEKKHPKAYSIFSLKLSKKKGYTVARFYLLMGMILLYIWLMAIIYGDYSYKEVLKQQDITVRYHNNEILVGKQIGKTGDIIFLLDVDHKTRAIPIQSLVKDVRY